MKHLRIVKFLLWESRLWKRFIDRKNEFLNKERKKPYTDHQREVHRIIFEADTIMGKLFDVALLVAIVISILIVMLESVPSIQGIYKSILHVMDWIVTILFTIEYGFRIYCVKKPWKYIFSFYGIIDLLSIMPTYLSAVLDGSQYLSSVRAIRLLRVFRVLKLTQYLTEFETMATALRASGRKISVFLGTVMIIVVIVGSIMYYVEGLMAGNTNFSSIPRSVYWGIVTVTTVGYGDIAPVTAMGQFIAAILMLVGYGIIAVPTGIVSAEFVKGASNKKVEETGVSEFNTRSCQSCSREGHAVNAKFCKFCGEEL